MMLQLQQNWILMRKNVCFRQISQQLLHERTVVLMYQLQNLQNTALSLAFTITIIKQELEEWKLVNQKDTLKP